MQVISSPQSAVPSAPDRAGESLQNQATATTANFCSVLDTAFAIMSSFATDKTLSSSSPSPKDLPSKNTVTQSKSSPENPSRASAENLRTRKGEKTHPEITSRESKNREKEPEDDKAEHIKSSDQNSRDREEQQVIRDETAREASDRKDADKIRENYEEEVSSSYEETDPAREQNYDRSDDQQEIPLDPEVAVLPEIIQEPEVTVTTDNIPRELPEADTDTAPLPDQSQVQDLFVLEEPQISGENISSSGEIVTSSSFMDLLNASRSTSTQVSSAAPETLATAASSVDPALPSDAAPSASSAETVAAIEEIPVEAETAYDESSSPELKVLREQIRSNKGESPKVVTDAAVNVTGEDATAEVNSSPAAEVNRWWEMSKPAAEDVSGGSVSFAEHLKTVSENSRTGDARITAEATLNLQSSTGSDYGRMDTTSSSAVLKVADAANLASDGSRQQSSLTSQDQTPVQGTDFKNVLQDKIQQNSEILQKTLHLSRNLEENVRQLSEKINMMLSRNLREAQIDLDPVGLGKMKIVVNVNDDGIARINMVVQQSETKDLISDSLGRLKTFLEQQGLSLGESSVEQQQSWGDRSQNNRSDQTKGATSDKISNLADMDSLPGDEIVFQSSVAKRAVDYFA
ncbi:MAG: flagellar hook-length control protein FliK [Succinivibrionaceae bacterium]